VSEGVDSTQPERTLSIAVRHCRRLVGVASFPSPWYTTGPLPRGGWQVIGGSAPHKGVGGRQPPREEIQTDRPTSSELLDANRGVEREEQKIFLLSYSI